MLFILMRKVHITFACFSVGEYDYILKKFAELQRNSSS